MNFRKRQTRRLTIDITPLIDVIFLLLIFFMVSTTFITAPGIHVNLPTASGKANPDNTDPIEITVTLENKIFINGKLITKQTLKGALNEAKNNTKNQTVIIKADGGVKHQLVVDIMDAAKQVDIKRLSIATRPNPGPQS